jgi:hypothetical protein
MASRTDLCRPLRLIGNMRNLLEGVPRLLKADGLPRFGP